MEYKHQLSEGKLYSCHILILEGDGTLEETTLVIDNNAEEARNKAEDWFKQENPSANRKTSRTLSETQFILV